MIEATEQKASNQFITDYNSDSIMLQNFKPRLYQQTILNTCSKSNTLVVLPTGMGKTSLAFMLGIQRLNNFPDSKILVLAPTKPLVEQHKSTFLKYMTIDKDEISVFTGFVKPEKRKELWKTSRVILSTPQGLENDIITQRINLSDVSLLVFDESHRAVGDYAYTFIAKQYVRKAKFPRILGLTASPGSDVEKIMEVCENLSIEDVEIRTDTDPDVKPYIQDVKVDWVKVELDDKFKAIQKLLVACYNSKIKEVKDLGYLNANQATRMGKLELLKFQSFLHGQISKGEKDMEILRSVSLIAEALKVQHAIELIETQGITPLCIYMERLMHESTKTTVKAVKNLVKDFHFRTAYMKIKLLKEKTIEHPKFEKLKEIMKKEVSEEDPKTIIFTQYRDTASKINEELNLIPGVSAKIFVGQTKKGATGMSQKQQKEIIDQFSNNGFNTLIATSVAEEGLDIPKVNTVIFYEPIPSAIRHIQRRGRTGRLDKGSVKILMTTGTRDEGYRWSAHHKEKRMHRILQDLKKKISIAQMNAKNQDLNRFITPDIEVAIIADDREKGAGIIKELSSMGAKVNMRRLEIGDYMLSSQCVVEFKTVADFVDSIVDSRIFGQIRELKGKYNKPLIIIQGSEDIYSQRSIHPNAIRGVLATITIDYAVPVIQTKNAIETASLLTVIAKREQEGKGKDFDFHVSKRVFTTAEQQEYIMSSFPGVGPTLAKPLLERFGTIKNIVNAKEDELKQIAKIGEKKAKGIQKLLTEEYKP